MFATSSRFTDCCAHIVDSLSSMYFMSSMCVCVSELVEELRCEKKETHVGNMEPAFVSSISVFHTFDVFDNLMVMDPIVFVSSIVFHIFDRLNVCSCLR